jgi:hypothetical protein
MISSQSYTRIVRTGAWYDLLATIAFATPWSFAAVHSSLVWLTQTLQLSGAFPAFDPVHVLMANLLGSIVTAWAILRIRDPQHQFGRYNVIVRVAFITWQLYALSQGASMIILGFTVILIGFAIAESLPATGRVIPAVSRRRTMKPAT